MGHVSQSFFVFDSLEYTNAMNITSATFVKSARGSDAVLEDGRPQIAFIGRSNVGKSSVINALTGKKGLAKTSSFPGRTQLINIFLINRSMYFVDLPGYGFAKLSKEDRESLQKMVDWYLFRSEIDHAFIVLIIDAKVGLTDADVSALEELDAHEKNVLIIANKIDKIKSSELQRQLFIIKSQVGDHPIIPFSAEKKIGVRDVVDALLL